LRAPVETRKNEAGQATILVILATGIFLLAAVGLAVDGSHLYAQWQMAQAAADAAAQAGVMSVFYGTNSNGAATAFSTTAFTCSASDPKTPCYYAQQLNGFNGGSDSVSVDFPSIGDAAVGVTVSRSVDTTLIRLLGPSASTISARGVAAVEDIPSAIPIIVTHPTLTGALSFNGNPNITIIGGPRRSIQVNSNDPASIATNACGNATVDLSLAGPGGKGADFGDLGGQPAPPCFTFKPGVGRYVQPAGVISDPLSGVDPNGTWITTSSLVLNPSTTTVPVGTNGCPSVSGTPICTVFHPGLYTTGITIKDSTNNSNGVALFAPGLYYISSGGFNMQAKASAQIASGMTADPLYPEIGTAGMVVFNSGTGNADRFAFDANAGKFYPIALQGAPVGSRWDGILFMEDPYATGGIHTGLPSANKGHTIQGAGNITLTGTMYFNARVGVTSTAFQSLSVQGASGSTTTLTGEIITQALSLGGGGTIKMNLDSTTRTVREVALIQ
jgi:hypothetical protein